MAYSAKDGWFFERRPDGSVEMQKRLPIRTKFTGDIDGWPVEHVVFDAVTWASIVASVSASGEHGETFRWAEAFHAGIRPAETPGTRATTEGQTDG